VRSTARRTLHAYEKHSNSTLLAQKHSTPSTFFCLLVEPLSQKHAKPVLKTKGADAITVPASLGPLAASAIPAWRSGKFAKGVRVRPVAAVSTLAQIRATIFCNDAGFRTGRLQCRFISFSLPPLLPRRCRGASFQIEGAAVRKRG
jgi:hypothetical protein